MFEKPKQQKYMLVLFSRNKKTVFKLLKKPQLQMKADLKTQKMCKYYHDQTLYSCSIHITFYVQKIGGRGFKSECLRHSHVGLFFTNKGQTKADS